MNEREREGRGEGAGRAEGARRGPGEKEGGCNFDEARGGGDEATGHRGAARRLRGGSATRKECLPM